MSIFASCEPKFLYCDQNHLKLGNRYGALSSREDYLRHLSVQYNFSIIYSDFPEHAWCFQPCCSTVRPWSCPFQPLSSFTGAAGGLVPCSMKPQLWLRYGRGTNLPHPNFPTEQEISFNISAVTIVLHICFCDFSPCLLMSLFPKKDVKCTLTNTVTHWYFYSQPLVLLQQRVDFYSD